VSAKTCPRCVLVNPGNADRCDCGFDFSKATPESIVQQLKVAEHGAVWDVVASLVIGLSAIGLAVFQYLVAQPGDRIFLPTGLAIFGVLAAGRAITKYENVRLARRQRGPGTPTP
jgi:hypothetical protein